MRSRRVVFLCLLTGCARPSPSSSDSVGSSQAKRDDSPAPKPQPEPTPEPEVGPEPLLAPGCAIDAAAGEPWTELIPSILELSTFPCPAKLRVVQRRPWYGLDFDPARITPPGPDDVEGEIHAITGRDPNTGRVVWATLVHAPKFVYKDLMHWLVRKFQPAACTPAEVAPGWYCLEASSRSKDGAEPLREWLEAHPEVEAVDWIALDTWKYAHELEEIDWTKQPRVLVLRERGGLSVCWFAGEARRCSRLDGVDSGEIVRADNELVLDTKVGRRKTRFALTSGGKWVAYEEPRDPYGYGRETKAPDYDIGDVTRWQPLEVTTPDRDYAELARLYPAEVIRTRGDGVVLGRYAEVGSAGVREVTMATWILIRQDAGWVATAVPDLVVHDLVAAGSSLGLIASWFLLGDGPSYERRELLMFTPRDGTLEFVGQLDTPVAMVAGGPTSDYEWSHEIVAAGPDCLSLRAGPSSGEIYDDQEVAHPITKQVRERFAALTGTWRITPEGPQRGC